MWLLGLNSTPEMEKARNFALAKHNVPENDLGHPYVWRLDTRMDTLTLQTLDPLGCTLTEEDIIVEYLADLLNETNTTFEELVENFGLQVAERVLARSKPVQVRKFTGRSEKGV